MSVTEEDVKSAYDQYLLSLPSPEKGGTFDVGRFKL